MPRPFLRGSTIRPEGFLASIGRHSANPARQLCRPKIGVDAPGHEVVHVTALSWESLANGRLLDSTEGAGFQVLLTVDQNLRFQQNIGRRRVSLCVIEARRIDIESLAMYVPDILTALQGEVSPGSVIVSGQSSH